MCWFLVVKTTDIKHAVVCVITACQLRWELKCRTHQKVYSVFARILHTGIVEKCYEETDKVVNTLDWTRRTVAGEIVNVEIGCSQSRMIEVDDEDNGRDGRTVCLKGGLVRLTSNYTCGTSARYGTV